MLSRKEFDKHISLEDESAKCKGEFFRNYLEKTVSSKYDLEFNYSLTENGFSFVLIKKSAAVNRNLLYVSFDGRVIYSQSGLEIQGGLSGARVGYYFLIIFVAPILLFLIMNFEHIMKTDPLLLILLVLGIPLISIFGLVYQKALLSNDAEELTNLVTQAIENTKNSI